MFSSTATDPAKPLEPDVARNGNIYNLWTLNLKTANCGSTPTCSPGNLSPVVLREGTTAKVAFVTYFKGDYGLHTHRTARSRRDRSRQRTSARLGR